MKPTDAHWTCPNHPLAGPGVSGRAVAPLCHRPGCDYKTTMVMVHSWGCDGTHDVGDCNRLAFPAEPRPLTDLIGLDPNFTGGLSADAVLIAAARNALPALLDELATERRQGAALASITGEAIRQLGEERDAAREELAKVRAELDEFKALSRDYNWQWQLESGVSGIFEGRAAWLYRNSTRMTQMRYDAMSAAKYDFTQYTAQMNQPVDREALLAYLREEITFAEREIAAIEANPATTAEPADEPKATVSTALGNDWSDLLNDDEPECGHDRAKADDTECPECGADLAALDAEPAAG